MKWVHSVFNELKFGHREVVYQRALATELTKQKLSYNKELSFPIRYSNTIVSRYFVDFLVEESIIVEVKVGNELFDSYIKQAIAYLKQSRYSLALLALFTPQGVKIKRVII